MTNLNENYRNVFDHRLGFGQKPALLIIDFIKAYTEPESPLYAEDVVTAVERSKELVKYCRQNNVPIIFTQVLYNPSMRDGGLFVQKGPSLQKMTADEPMAQLVDELPPGPEDTIISKQYASCFFGTSLSSTLRAMGVDTLILAGCSTSGCVRATAVDGMQHGFRVIVPKECVGDRHQGPHEANLFDINAKYGDVLSLNEVIDNIEQL